MTRAIVYHRGYGCDTGCCGHVVELQDDNEEPLTSEFSFTHPNLSREDWREFVREMVTDAFGTEHVADIAWDDCLVVDD
jgi:hypothetical protein